MAAGIASLLGLDAAEEFLDRQGPRKVMVPGADLKKLWKPGDPLDINRLDYSKLSVEELDIIVRRTREPYQTTNPQNTRGSLQQEFEMNVGWRAGDWIGREGATVGKLMEGKLPHGCQLGPRARLVNVDEARKTLRFELNPLYDVDWLERRAVFDEATWEVTPSKRMKRGRHSSF